MTAIPHDHVLRFRFESENRPDIAHVVDLGEFGGFGECSCEDFCFRLRPVLVARRNADTGTYQTGDLKRCKHLQAAREVLVNQVIARISEGERGLA